MLPSRRPLIVPRLPGRAAGRSSARRAPASRRPRSRSAGGAPWRRRSARRWQSCWPARDGLAFADRERAGLQWANMKSKPDRPCARRRSSRRRRPGSWSSVIVPASGASDGGAFGRQDVLAFVDVAAARCAVAVFRATEVVRPGDREDGAVGDGLGGRGNARCAARRWRPACAGAAGAGRPAPRRSGAGDAGGAPRCAAG